MPSGRGARREYWRTIIFPLLLVATCPPLVPVIWTVVTRLDGSVQRAVTPLGLDTILHHLPRPSLAAAGMILLFTSVQILLLFVLPAKRLLGPTTPTGNRPSYRLNGVASFVVTHVLFWGGVASGAYPATIIYDHFGALLATLCVVALLFCLALFIKGRVAPTNSDTTITGNFVFDYFQGTELHPQLWGVDLKQLCNCRLSMMSWPLIVVSFAAKQHALYGRLSPGMAIAVVLQAAYILKFFVWESGYFASLDITHDRFGFYICWGVLCWVPCVYTLSTLYLVDHPADLSPLQSGCLLAFGLGMLLFNYLADRQRQIVRAMNGNVTVWGKAPRLIEAPYVTRDGKARSNLLLASGYWGVARHFHYVPELLLALAWTVPAGHERILPYFYFVFLLILLVDRAGRDDLRCEAKYGAAWHEYRAAVPYKMFPGVY